MVPAPVLDCIRRCNVETTLGWILSWSSIAPAYVWGSLCIWSMAMMSLRISTKNKFFVVFSLSIYLELYVNHVVAMLAAKPAPQPHCSATPLTAFPSLGMQLVCSFSLTYLLYLHVRHDDWKQRGTIWSFFILFGLPIYQFIAELYLQEHTIAQTSVGALIGSAMGIVRTLFYIGWHHALLNDGPPGVLPVM